MESKTRFQLCFRCNNDAQLFHHVEWLPGNVARRFEPDCHERVGWRVHVLHLRESSRVRLRELRRSQAADAQRCLSSGREPRHPGTLLIDVSSIILFNDKRIYKPHSRSQISPNDANLNGAILPFSRNKYLLAQIIRLAGYKSIGFFS